ncbi:TPA: DUF3592 domain-containing protein [Vibrio cholerae]|nr:DUF3592 domain-containing protein [Vibrio cholerae]
MFFNILISGGLLVVFFNYLDTKYTEIFTFAPKEVLIAMMIAMILSAVNHIVRSFYVSRAKGWPSVTGKILYVTQKKNAFSERFQIVYSYEVNGVRYRGDQFDLASRYAKYGSLRRYCRMKKEELMSKAVQGRQVKVFYNPELSSDCVLDNNPTLSLVVSQIPSYTVIFISMYYLAALIIDVLQHNGIM